MMDDGVHYERPPKIKIQRNTERLDASPYVIATKRDSGLAKGKRQIPHQENNVAKMMCHREIGLYDSFSPGNKCKTSNHYLPNTIHCMDIYDSNGYCGVFSKDGNLFLTGAQDHILRLYDSGNGSYKMVKQVRSSRSGWSIIDVAFSPDGRHFLFSSWCASLFLCSTNEQSEEQVQLNLNMDHSHSGCIFSVVFSADGKEVLGGGNDRCIRIVDLETREETYQVHNAHERDINGAVYADYSSNILYTGSDDGYIKVWDKRLPVGFYPQPVGVLAGHLDGITYIDTKKDGRHLISNSKDQSVKLWDIRAFSKPQTANTPVRHLVRSLKLWDYRFQRIPPQYFTTERNLDCDTSIMTYRGHLVHKTLIRCRFSPMHNTGQRYIYTGCGTGRVVIYDSLTGDIAASLKNHDAVVRDVDWHPVRNEILSTSWDCNVGKWIYVDKDCSEDSVSDSLEEKRKIPKLLLNLWAGHW